VLATGDKVYIRFQNPPLPPEEESKIGKWAFWLGTVINTTAVMTGTTVVIEFAQDKEQRTLYWSSSTGKYRRHRPDGPLLNVYVTYDYDTVRRPENIFTQFEEALRKADAAMKDKNWSLVRTELDKATDIKNNARFLGAMQVAATSILATRAARVMHREYARLITALDAATRSEQAAVFLGRLPEDAQGVWFEFTELLGRLEAIVEVPKQEKNSKVKMREVQAMVAAHPSLNDMPRYIEVVELYLKQAHLDDKEEVAKKIRAIVFKKGTIPSVAQLKY